MSACQGSSNASYLAMMSKLLPRWAGHGPLLRRAAPEFDAFVTVDQGLEYQQNLFALDLIVIVMAAKSNDIDDLRPLMPQVREALEKSSPGSIVRVQI